MSYDLDTISIYFFSVPYNSFTLFHTFSKVRACRNAIEFNSIPSINRLVPGGYDKLKLSVILAVPPKYQEGLDLEAVAKVFPYGETEFIIQDGGMIAPSGIAIGMYLLYGWFLSVVGSFCIIKINNFLFRVFH